MAAWIDATLLRIWISDDDTYGDLTLQEAIVRKAHEAGLAGVTVSRGISGFGRSTHVHEIFGLLAYDLPMTVEIIDTPAKIDAWLPVIEDMRQGALVTRESVEVLQPRGPGEPADLV